ncbi:MAG: putative manganese-dependent inorganic diphosphatase [Planctomycetota bacterium]|jgi:manganese-dependent inorganic pyrophosphatase|nr:putative manganese-dependent inorganic diphosphatase [Planctomycetota bacterium]
MSESIIKTRISERITLQPQSAKTVYVIGHRNPDTDSCVAAAAYAALKEAQGMRHCVAARAGKTTPQTEYIFQRCKIPLPEFVPDLIPRVDYYDNHRARTVSTGVSLWDAMAAMRAADMQALPVVDEDGRYHSLLHYGFIAERLVHINNPSQKTAIQTSVELVAGVLRAQALVLRNEKEVRKSPIIVAAAQFEHFAEMLSTHVPSNTIVISGNRPDVLRHAVAEGVRLIITTNGYILDRELKEEAERKNVSVLSSPYDTSSTTLLIIYSMPVSAMSTTALQPVGRRDPIKKVAPLLSDAPGKSLPVVNESGKVVGVISESDIYRAPNIEVIMVDHNEVSQAIEGIENYRILEIIDHHRLGNPPTRDPIAFINKPVGATCTIVTEMYRESRVPLSQGMASLLLCGIIADTLTLQSATTTDQDREMAEYLANITNNDIEKLGKDIISAASRTTGRTAQELVFQDMKEYAEQGETFTVSQIEVEDTTEVLDRRQEFLAVLDAERAKGDKLFSALMVTDIAILSSIMLVSAAPKFVRFITLPRHDESVYEMRGIVSRKKQMMPLLSELIEKYKEA